MMLPPLHTHALTVLNNVYNNINKIKNQRTPKYNVHVDTLVALAAQASATNVVVATIKSV